MLDFPSVQTLVYYIGWLHLGLWFLAGLWLVYIRVGEWAETWQPPAWDWPNLFRAWGRAQLMRSGLWEAGLEGHKHPWRVR